MEVVSSIPGLNQLLFLFFSPKKMISSCNALFFPSRIRRIIFKITRQCTTQKKNVVTNSMSPLFCNYSNSKFFLTRQTRHQQQYIFFQGQGPHLSESDFLFEMSAAHLHHHIVVAKLICHFYSSRGCNVW